jgi:hypothetical protein
MLRYGSNGKATKAEIAFETFPSGPRATEADRLLSSLEGVFHILIDPAVRRVAFLFDPTKVDIPAILSALQPFGLKPRVISVICPMKEVI